MRQLQLFTTAELAKMRDRTKARNYSPERDEFRREHERRRAFGLARRHAQRMYNSFQRAASACEKDREGPTSRTPEPIASERAARAALNWRSQTNPDRSRRQPKRNDQPAPAEKRADPRRSARIGPRPAVSRPAPASRVGAGSGLPTRTSLDPARAALSRSAGQAPIRAGQHSPARLAGRAPTQAHRRRPVPTRPALPRSASAVGHMSAILPRPVSRVRAKPAQTKSGKCRRGPPTRKFPDASGDRRCRPAIAGRSGPGLAALPRRPASADSRRPGRASQKCEPRFCRKEALVEQGRSPSRRVPTKRDARVWVCVTRANQIQSASLVRSTV